MKAAIASGIQDIDKYLSVENDWDQPTLATSIDGKTGQRNKVWNFTSKKTKNNYFLFNNKKKKKHVLTTNIS